VPHSVGLVLASAAAVAAVAGAMASLSASMAFVLGAVLVSTDPVAVGALARRISLPARWTWKPPGWLKASGRGRPSHAVGAAGLVGCQNVSLHPIGAWRPPGARIPLRRA